LAAIHGLATVRLLPVFLRKIVAFARSAKLGHVALSVFTGSFTQTVNLGGLMFRCILAKLMYVSYGGKFFSPSLLTARVEPWAHPSIPP
jgi:hypothetical protein